MGFLGWLKRAFRLRACVVAVAALAPWRAVAGTPQAITFPDIPLLSATSPPFPLAATASSGMSVTYEVVVGTNVATVSGSNLVLTGEPGVATVKASQAGDSAWDPAPDAFASVAVVEGPTGFRMVAAGDYHTLAIKMDGSLWGWGKNQYGQVGNRTTIDAQAPVRVGVDADWAFVAGGASHSIGIRSNGTLWAWGMNSSGQLGDGTTSQSLVPIQVGTNTNWTTAAAGGSHSAGVQADGSLWTWGSDGQGQLGNGSAPGTNMPGRVGAEFTWRQVAAGDQHTLAVKTNGTLWGWGDNMSRQLGLMPGSTYSYTLPELIESGKRWTSVSAGFRGSSGIRDDGGWYAWGLFASVIPSRVGSTGQTWVATSCHYGGCVAVNNNGTVWGFGGALPDMGLAPSKPAQLLDGSNWLAVCSGFEHGGAVAQDGALWMWGSGRNGQRGVPSEGCRPVFFPRGLCAAMAAGHGFSVMVATNGTLWTWGGSSPAKIEGMSNVFEEVPLQVGTGSNFVDAVAGKSHGGAVADDGSAWMWGLNWRGQLGDGSVANRSNLVQFGTGPWSALAAGLNHTVAVRPDGTLWGAGDDSVGQIGKGAGTGFWESPVQASFEANWNFPAAGLYHSAALRGDHSLWMWGYNLSGQIGNGTTVTRYSPVQVGPELLWAGVSPGASHTVAQAMDGALWAWGANQFGELGIGGGSSKASPVPVGADTNWSRFAGGANHTLALKTDHTLWGWGRGDSGQAGDGSNSNRLVPTQVGLANVWSAIPGQMPAAYHVLATTLDGTLWEWGHNRPEMVAPRESQTIQFPDFTLPGIGGSAPLSATASSGLPAMFGAAGPVTLSNNVLTVTGAGPVTVFAYQPGDTYWNAAGPVVPAGAIAVSQAGAPGELANGAGPFDFGTRYVGSPSNRTFQVRNSAAGAGVLGLNITVGGDHPADFTVARPDPAFLNAGETTFFAVVFLPTAGGARTALVQIASTALADNPFTLLVTGTGDAPPSISGVSNQVIGLNGAMPATPFEVGDAETAASNLVVTAVSSNTLLAPPGGLELGGTGSNRTVAVAPAVDQLGTTLITLTVSEAPESKASVSFTLTVTGTVFQAWRQLYFGSAADAGPGAASADPNGNGAPNLADFAFGADPVMASAPGKQPQPGSAQVDGTNYFAISFRRLTNAVAGVRYRVLESTDTVTWHPLDLATHQVGLPVNNGDGTETVTVRASAPMAGPGAGDHALLRVEVSE